MAAPRKRHDDPVSVHHRTEAEPHESRVPMIAIALDK
jgi:hypothetical protein